MRALFAVGAFLAIIIAGGAIGFGFWALIPAVMVSSFVLTFGSSQDTQSRSDPGGFGRTRYAGRQFGTRAQSDAVRISETGFSTFFQIAGHISKADGRVSRLEIRQTNDFMDRLSLNSEQRRVAIASFNDGKNAAFDLKRCIEKLRASSGMGSLARELLFEAMVNLATIDGVTETKRRLLFAYADALGIAAQTAQNYIARHRQSYWQQYSSYESHREHFQQRRQNWQRDSRDSGGNGRQSTAQGDELQAAYETLGVSQQDTDSVVKRSYQRKIAETHPDKFHGKDLPAFLIEAATAKASEINEAWNTIKKSRRMS